MTKKPTNKILTWYYKKREELYGQVSDVFEVVKILSTDEEYILVQDMVTDRAKLFPLDVAFSKGSNWINKQRRFHIPSIIDNYILFPFFETCDKILELLKIEHYD